MRCHTEGRVGCPEMSSSGTASILPLNILVMAAKVVVINAMVAPLVRYEEKDNTTSQRDTIDLI